MKLFAALAVLLSTLVFAGPVNSEQQRAVDLRDPHALENLQKSDPAAFEQITRIIAGLRDKPNRAEGDWLQVNFSARDVGLSRFIYRTSLPPMQLLSFTLRDVRYTMYVARPDVVGQIKPAH